MVTATGRHWGPATALVALALTAVSLAGCARGAVAQEGFMSYDEMRAEYDRTLEDFPADLPFPEGVDLHPALETRTVLEPNTTDLFEVGSGSGYAYVYWECMWMLQVLAADGVGEKADQGLDMLESALDSDMRARHFDDSSGVWENQVLRSARQGDLSLLKDFAVGCEGDS